MASLKFHRALTGAAISIISIHLALAQSNVPPSSGQKLDEMSRAQSNAHHINPGPPPPQSSVIQPKIYPLHGLWICKGTRAFKPIRLSPNSKSRRIGETLHWIATTGPYVNGYAKVISFGGKVGFVNKQFMLPFHDKFAPNAGCTVEGVNAQGVPMYSIR